MMLLVLHGPNLNLLGRREPHLYGTLTLAELDAELIALGASLGASVETFQSNHEGALVDRLQLTRDDGTDGLVINAAALTHTSIALRDALVFSERPAIEVHLSNVYAREPFRHTSMLADVCVGLITGLGPDSYRLALRALISRLGRPTSPTA